MFRLNHLLERAARMRPDAVALVEGDRQVTYRELDQSSSRFAAWLVHSGVRPGERVGLFLPKCTEAVIALYGIMKAGATYVPIDASAPVSRAKHIVQDCDVRCVVTTPQKGMTLFEALDQSDRRPTPIVVGSDSGSAAPKGAVPWSDAIARANVAVLPSGTECDLSYILYTSGSTGQPKGVMISHRAALTFVDWACSCFDLGPEDVVSSHAPLHFDLSVFDLFATAKAGGTVVLFADGATTFPIQLTRAVERFGITVWYSVPSALVLMMERGKFAELDTTSLRVILFAGEVFPTPQLRRLREATDARLYNLFGPTETNVCTFYEVVDLPDDDGETIPIGQPISNYAVFFIDEDGAAVDGSETGELIARGPGLMCGYWGDPEKTGRTLVQNPLHRDYHDPVYKTGDLVHTDDQGLLRFVGRRDHQVKIRGYRIELGEVEAAVYSLAGIAEAVAVVVPREGGEKSLVLVVVLEGGTSLTERDVIGHCASRIPRYMIPEQVIVTDALPHTSTGKIDRRAALSEVLSRTT